VSASNPAAPEPTEIAGRYQVVRKLGAGAFGTVYKAKDKRLERMVAIKTIRLEGLAASQAGFKEMLERFEREAKTAAKLKHPGIVTIYDYDFGESHGLSFIAMEFIDGVGIDSIIAQTGRLSVERAAALGAQIAEALDYAHQYGVVHRDIKPANIMIEAGDRVKVTDFGIAKPGDSAEHLTMTGSLLGTPSYMSPEQARGQKLDGRSDLFSVGCVLYEMVAGKKAFRGDSITALLFKIITEEPPPLRELEPTVSEEMVRIIAKALAKTPDARYQSGREMADDLLALTKPGFVPTLRSADTPTLPPPHDAATLASAPTAHATLEAAPTLARESATSSTQPGPAGAPIAPTILTPATATSARSGVTVPPLPPRLTPPAPGAGARPAPPARASKGGSGLGLVLGLVAFGVLALAMLGGGAWWFLSQRAATTTVAVSPTPTPTPVPVTSAATPTPGPAEATPASTLPSPVAAATTPFPPSTPPPTPDTRRPTTPTKVAAGAPSGRTQPPATESDAPAAAGGDEYAFLDEPQGQDGRAAGDAVAQKFRAGGSSGIGSTRFARRERFPRHIAPGERPAVGTLAQLMFAQEAFHRTSGHYGTLRELTGAGLLRLRVAFANGVFEKQSYRFELTGGGGEYRATATPLGSGTRPFVVDDNGFVRVDE